MFSALIIDPDSRAVQVIERALGVYGFDFTTIPNAQNAMSFARNVTPDIIFLRVELVDVSGFSVCDQLRRKDKTKYIPLVMYFSTVPEHIVGHHRNLETHADAYLKLPFAPELLVSTVADLIPLDGHE